MKSLHVLVLTAFLAAQGALAQELPVVVDSPGVTLEEFLWVKRPVLVFADSPEDPNFKRQMELILRDRGDLNERDVVVITDTDPAGQGFFRKRFRPRGFGLVLMDKDGITTLRKPLPWDVREISRAIDKFPLARQEQLERYPSGR